MNRGSSNGSREEEPREDKGRRGWRGNWGSGSFSRERGYGLDTPRSGPAGPDWRGCPTIRGPCWLPLLCRRFCCRISGAEISLILTDSGYTVLTRCGFGWIPGSFLSFSFPRLVTAQLSRYTEYSVQASLKIILQILCGPQKLMLLSEGLNPRRSIQPIALAH